jgi:hypothetical protein
MSLQRGELVMLKKNEDQIDSADNDVSCHAAGGRVGRETKQMRKMYQTG